MESHSDIITRMLADRLIGVVRLRRPADLGQIVDAMAGNMTIVEITLTTPDALSWIERLAARGDLLVGAGSVLSQAEAWTAIGAGARFIASPIFDPDVRDAVRASGCAYMPGALTPTEIVAAWRGGADIVKLFPAPADATGYIRSLCGPLPGIPLAPSGGVDAATAPALLEAGAAALNVGTWLTHGPDGVIEPAAIAARAEALRRVVPIVAR